MKSYLIKRSYNVVLPLTLEDQCIEQDVSFADALDAATRQADIGTLEGTLWIVKFWEDGLWCHSVTNWDDTCFYQGNKEYQAEILGSFPYRVEEVDVEIV